MKPLWVIRAGRGGVHVDDFLARGVVAFGERVDLSACPDKAAVAREVASHNPEINRHQLGVATAQAERFLREIEVGHRVATYDPQARVYHLGTVTGDVQHVPQGIGGGDAALLNVRSVKWDGTTVRRAKLSVGTRNTLGAILSLFRPNPEAAGELEAAAAPASPDAASATVGSDRVSDAPDVTAADEAGDELEDVREDMAARSRELVGDRLEALAWDDMQELFAAVLRAMGYKTLVSPPGADRGKDIVASPDGLGLQEPRIKVEVKHRAGTTMGAPEVRSFLGGLRPGDRGVFLSTGGFSREARYEAERAQVPLTLLTLDDLVTLIFEHYPQIDERGRTLVPLQRLYWPLA